MSRLKAKWLVGAVVPILVLTDLGALSTARAAMPTGEIVLAQSEELSPEEELLRRKQQRQEQRKQERQEQRKQDRQEQRQQDRQEQRQEQRQQERQEQRQEPKPDAGKAQRPRKEDGAGDEAPARPKPPKTEQNGKVRSETRPGDEETTRPRRNGNEETTRPRRDADEETTRPRRDTGEETTRPRPDGNRPSKDAEQRDEGDQGGDSATDDRTRRERMRDELRNRQDDNSEAGRPRDRDGNRDGDNRRDDRRPGDRDGSDRDRVDRGRGPAEIGEIRNERQRREVNGREVIIEPGGRTIIRRGNRTVIRYNELDRLEDSGDVRRERRGRNDVTIVERGNGVRILTFTDEDGHVVRRVRRTPDGKEYVLFVNRADRSDDYGLDIIDLPPPVVSIPQRDYVVEAERASPRVIYDTFAAPPVAPVTERYSLEQVVNSPTVLERVRRVDIDTITFDTGSWTVPESQISALDGIAKAINDLLAKNPNEVFLIEGHTDAVGADIDNLSLSDRRASEVAYLLTEYYDVPPENMTTRGYGEAQLKVQTDGPSRENRRVTMRRITPLLETSDAGAQ